MKPAPRLPFFEALTQRLEVSLQPEVFGMLGQNRSVFAVESQVLKNEDSQGPMRGVSTFTAILLA
jgi:hypothetical protein